MAFVPVAFFRRTEHFVIATFSQTLGGCLSGVSQAPAVRASLHERHDSTLIKKSEVWVYRSKKKKKKKEQSLFLKAQTQRIRTSPCFVLVKSPSGKHRGQQSCIHGGNWELKAKRNSEHSQQQGTQQGSAAPLPELGTTPWRWGSTRGENTFRTPTWG